MIQRLTRREQNIFVISLLVTVLYLGYRFIVLPLREHSDQLDGKIDAELRRLRSDLSEVGKAKQWEELYGRLVQTFQQTGSDEQVKSSMLQEIQDVARDMNLQISDLKPQRVKATEFYKTFSVSLRLDNSSLDDILPFLHLLQSKPHLFDVQEVRLDKSSRRDAKTIMASIVLDKTFISE